MLTSLLIALLLVAALGVARGAAPQLTTIRQLNSGQYSEAEARLRRVIPRMSPGPAAYAARYNLAVALHRQGRFAESRAELDAVPLDHLDASLHGAANALYAWNLVHLGVDLGLAERCLSFSGPLVERPATQLALAYIAYRRGEAMRGDALFARVHSTPVRRDRYIAGIGGSTLVIDDQFEALIEEFTLGLCALEQRDAARARVHLERVAMVAHPSFYPAAARDLLVRAWAPQQAA